MEVPQGFEKYYAKNCLLLLLKTLYGTKQAAKAFWLKLLEALHGMGYKRSKADPCLCFDDTVGGLVIWLLWVDDCLICGPRDQVEIAKQNMMKRFECDEVGELKEYVGCKVDYNHEEGWIKLTQPVLMKSYTDEFKLPEGETPRTPATPGGVLQKYDPKDAISEKEQSIYRSGVGKLLHMMKWTQPEILNAVRELSRFMTGTAMAHLKEMYRAMKYCVGTPSHGLLLKPNMKWDGNPNFEFIVNG
jgi:Reverse transcriptase (RNA-dependent DNA polymerase)